MKKEKEKSLFLAAWLLGAFVLWTAAVRTLDVQTVGPEGSKVGFATINLAIHRMTGVNLSLYAITDWLGLVPFAVVFAFGLLGLVQWVRRKSLMKVDWSILVLGGFYLLVLAAYLFFEIVVVNYRPVLIDGELEASYPSSTTMLAVCVMATAVMQVKEGKGNRIGKQWVAFGMTVFAVFMVIGRLLSGVHWFSDIVGGGLLSGGLVMLYRFGCSLEGNLP